MRGLYKNKSNSYVRSLVNDNPVSIKQKISRRNIKPHINMGFKIKLKFEI